MALRPEYKQNPDANDPPLIGDVAARLNDAENRHASFSKEPRVRKTKDPAEKYGHTAKAKDEEEAAGGWKFNSDGFSPKEQRQVKRIEGALKFTRKRGPIMGIISTFFVGGGILAGFFGPANLLVNLSQNLSLTNDTRASTMEQRLANVLNKAMTPVDMCTGSKMKCNKMGKISNSSLRKLNAKGITPMMGNTPYTPPRTGYPPNNPSQYRMPDGRTVPANQMTSFLSQPENRRLAAQVYGRGGAWNMRFKAWTGKHIASKLFSRFPNLNKAGGTASSTNRGGSAADRRTNTRQQTLRALDRDGVNRAANNVSQKTTSQMKKAGKGGVGYLGAYAACLAVKLPGYIAAGVAAVQMAQLITIAMDYGLSPGSKVQAAGVTDDLEPEDVDVAATLLTEQTLDEDGNMTSALDSPYLLAALGVNKGKPSVSEFAPGYSALSNPAVKAAATINEVSEPLCNVIMSPGAMYTAMGISTALSVKTLGIGALVNLVGSFAIIQTASFLANQAAGPAIRAVLTAIAENDLIPQAAGKQLGDLIGISASGLFGSAGMAGMLPVVTQATSNDVRTGMLENEEFHREMEIASLSPFDTSSQYTFLGSIVHTLRFSALASGNHNNNFASVFKNILGMPGLALSTTVHGTPSLNPVQCSYAAEFGLTTENSEDTPCITMSGVPLTGLTRQQQAMSTDEAIDLIAAEGWFDESKNINDGDTIEDLISSGYIRGDTPMADFIESCTNAETGDYIYNAAACTLGSSGTVSANVSGTEAADDCVESADEDGIMVTHCLSDFESDEEFEGTSMEPVGTDRALAAIPVFLIDYQVHQAMNDEDDLETTSSVGTVTEGVEQGDFNPDPETTTEWASPIPSGVSYNGTSGYGINRCFNGQCAIHQGEDIAYRNADILAACTGVVTRVDNNGERREPGNGQLTNRIVVDCGGGIITRYHHYYYRTVKPGIEVGSRVTAGTPLAEVGNQGNTYSILKNDPQAGTHLHFEIRTQDDGSFSNSMNPVEYLRQRGINI